MNLKRKEKVYRQLDEVVYVASYYFDVKKKKEQSRLNKILEFNEQKNCKVMERRKSSIVLVSHRSHHNRSIVHKVRLIIFYFYFQLIKIQHKYPSSLKKKRSNNIIHVTIGLSKKIQLNNSNLSSVRILEICILQIFFIFLLKIDSKS